MWRLRILILFLPLCLGLPAVAGDDADDQAARALAREELLREAKHSVDGGDRGIAALEAMRRSLAADVSFADQVDSEDPRTLEMLVAFRKTIADRRLLLGRAVSEAEPEFARDISGAVLEASRLEEWLLGKEPSAVLVERVGAEAGTGQTYPYPPAPPVEKAVAAAKPPLPDAEEGGADAVTEGAEPAPPSAPTSAGAGHREDGADAQAPPRDAQPEQVTPWVPPNLPTWAREVVRAGEGGALLKRTFRLPHHPDIASLIEASRAAPAYVHPEIRVLQRHALLTGEVFPYNAPLSALRSLQADEHNKALQADQPQSALIDGGMVREKAQVVATYQELITRHSERIAAITARLDAMVVDLDAWKTQAALLAGEIEEHRKTLSEQDGAGVAQGDLGLRLAQARETCATLDIMLLYLSANRAQVRLSLLEALLRAANEEATAAESVHRRYERALQSLRRTRRLDRLSSDKRKIRRWIMAAVDQAPEAGSVAALRLSAYRALLEVNEVVRDAVHRRGLMTTPAGNRVTAEPNASEGTEDAQPEAADRRLGSMVREPEKANWDAKFVELARRELHDPQLRSAFGAELVAAHYAAVDARIGALVRAYDISRDELELHDRYRVGVTQAKDALQLLASDMFTVRARRLPAMLAASQEDFSAAMTGINEQREKNQSRLRLLVSYRRELRDLGTRSLLVRVDRTLMDPYLGDAMRGTRDALDSAGRWVSFQGDAHAGKFLEETWERILLVLAVLVIALLFARWARRVVDRWIERKVATYPEVARRSASVREEREQGREARQAADLAVAQTSVEEVLNQVREGTGGMPAEADVEEASNGTEEQRPEEGTS